MSWRMKTMFPPKLCPPAIPCLRWPHQEPLHQKTLEEEERASGAASPLMKKLNCTTWSSIRALLKWTEARKSGRWLWVLAWSSRTSPLILIWEKHDVYSSILYTLEEEWVTKQTKKILYMKVSLIHRFSARWDYNKEEWKK